VTCSYLVRNGTEWIEKSLLLAAIFESRDRGENAVEAFAYCLTRRPILHRDRAAQSAPLAAALI
jgi:hypothetical protein